MTTLKQTLDAISPVDYDLEPKIRAHLDNLTKPPGSLGALEDLVTRYCLITNSTRPVIGQKAIFTFAGDHGVAAEGVSAFPKEVTSQMVMNMLSGGAAVNVLARHAGARVQVIDVGVDNSLEYAPGLVRSKVKAGTDNIVNGPAMTIDEATAAIETGISLAEQAANNGVTLIGSGEMGIANTTPSSALFSVLLPCPVERITGRGTGIDDKTLTHKISVIERAIAANESRISGPLQTLAALGGLEIAAICGLCLGAAACSIPLVIDGFISSAGALVACRIDERVKDYLYFSHCSAEAGHRVFFEEFGVAPILDLQMRLGEGTGAAIAFSIIEASIKIYNEMATFESARVSNKSE